MEDAAVTVAEAVQAPSDEKALLTAFAGSNSDNDADMAALNDWFVEPGEIVKLARERRAKREELAARPDRQYKVKMPGRLLQDAIVEATEFTVTLNRVKGSYKIERIEFDKDTEDFFTDTGLNPASWLESASEYAVKHGDDLIISSEMLVAEGSIVKSVNVDDPDVGGVFDVEERQELAQMMLKMGAPIAFCKELEEGTVPVPAKVIAAYRKKKAEAQAALAPPPAKQYMVKLPDGTRRPATEEELIKAGLKKAPEVVTEAVALAGDDVRKIPDVRMMPNGTWEHPAFRGITLADATGKLTAAGTAMLAVGHGATDQTAGMGDTLTKLDDELAGKTTTEALPAPTGAAEEKDPHILALEEVLSESEAAIKTETDEEKEERIKKMLASGPFGGKTGTTVKTFEAPEGKGIGSTSVADKEAVTRESMKDLAKVTGLSEEDLKALYGVPDPKPAGTSSIEEDEEAEDDEEPEYDPRTKKAPKGDFTEVDEATYSIKANESWGANDYLYNDNGPNLVKTGGKYVKRKKVFVPEVVVEGDIFAELNSLDD